MADYVRDGLLRNPEGSYLHRGWQRWEALGCFEVYPEFCRSAALDLFMNRVHQTQLVQSGRAELVDEPAHIGERHSEIGARLGHQCVRCRVGLEVVAGSSELEHHAGQRRTETVMQVTTKSAPFLLASRHQSCASSLKVGRQPHRVRRDANLSSKILE